MSQHLDGEQIAQLLAKRLESDSLIVALHHLESCDSCRASVNMKASVPARSQSLQASLKTEAQSQHLSYEQLVGFVEGTLRSNEQPELSAHLDWCSACVEEINSLQELQCSLANVPPLHPMTIAPETLRAPEKSIWQVIETWFSWRFVGAGLAAATVLVLGFIWWQKYAPSQKSELAQATQPTVTQTPVSGAASAAPEQTTTTPAPEIVVALEDNGQRITVDRQGKIEGLTAVAGSDEAVVKAALLHQQLPVAVSLRELMLKKGSLMGRTSEAPVIKALYPIAKVLQTDRVTFRWEPMVDATEYRVTVLDGDFNILQTSEPLKETRWTVKHTLPRGKIYLWQVTAKVNGKELNSTSAAMPEARFQILSQPQFTKLKTKERQYVHSHLLLGIAYAQEGLIDEAAREFRLLQQANPQSPIPKKLLRNLFAAQN